MSSTELDSIDRQLIEAHIASGQPRYSIVLKLAGGAFVRRWTDDLDEALARHVEAVKDAGMRSVVTFDHLGLAAVAVDFPPDDKTIEQLTAECDNLIDLMLDRWTQTQH